MNRYVMALAAFIVLLSGCASSGNRVAASPEYNGGLPEIAAYDEPTYEPLPAMVAAN